MSCRPAKTCYSLSLFLVWKSGEAIALGFQHYILALGTAVMIPSFLVPYMGGSDVSSFFILNFFPRWFKWSSMLIHMGDVVMEICLVESG